MRTLISAMLLASTAVFAAPVLAQDPPQAHDGGHHDGGDRHGGGGDHGNRGGPPQGQAQPQNQPQRGPQGAPGGNRPQGGQTNVAPPAGPQGGRADPRFRGGQGFQGDRGPGGDPRQYGHAGGDPVGHPGWDNRGGNYGRPGDDGHPHDRPVYQDGRPGFAGQGYDRRGYDGRGHDGRPGGYDRGNGAPGGNWNRGWRNDNRYDWQGYRNAHRDIFRGGGYRAPGGYGYGYRRFGIGAAIAPAFFAQDYWIADPSYYRLPPAYGPYRWVRYYNDALLIDLRSGVVVDAIPGFFF
jgi:Ni/Co efflux regulator RcnB